MTALERVRIRAQGDSMSKHNVRWITRIAFGVCSLLVLAGIGLASIDEANAQGPDGGALAPSVDLDEDNVLLDLVIPAVGGWFRQEVSPTGGDVSLVFHYTGLILTSAFDAIAPYHPTAVGAYSRLGRRPASESVTDRNINIATVFASYRTLMMVAPHRAADWRQMVESAGLDPDNDSQDLSTPQGLGNFAARMVVENRRDDGFNMFGDTTNGYPFADTLGFVPLNTAYELSHPSRWQPLLRPSLHGNYIIQTHVTPQAANAAPYTPGFNPRDYRFPPPMDSDIRNMEAYRAQADYVLEITPEITEEQMLMVEFFDNKVRGFLIRPLVKQVDTQGILFINTMLNMVSYDALIVTWQEKMRYDAVRPISAIRYLYPDEMVTTWSENEQKFIEAPGRFWTSYIETPNHSEYPSGSTCNCAAYAQSLRRYTGTDDTQGFSGVRPAGSSRRAPGKVPAEDLVLSWDTWTDFETDCGESRIWGGAHFRPSVDNVYDVCHAIGDEVYEYFASLIDGTARPPSVATPLPIDPLYGNTEWAPR